ncbi:hypothetical protein D3C81_1518790 [compost metagenome]
MAAASRLLRRVAACAGNAARRPAARRGDSPLPAQRARSADGECGPAQCCADGDSVAPAGAATGPSGLGLWQPGRPVQQAPGLSFRGRLRPAYRRRCARGGRRSGPFRRTQRRLWQSAGDRPRQWSGDPLCPPLAFSCAGWRGGDARPAGRRGRIHRALHRASPAFRSAAQRRVRRSAALPGPGGHGA